MIIELQPHLSARAKRERKKKVRSDARDRLKIGPKGVRIEDSEAVRQLFQNWLQSLPQSEKLHIDLKAVFVRFLRLEIQLQQSGLPSEMYSGTEGVVYLQVDRSSKGDTEQAFFIQGRRFDDSWRIMQIGYGTFFSREYTEALRIDYHRMIELLRRGKQVLYYSLQRPQDVQWEGHRSLSTVIWTRPEMPIKTEDYCLGPSCRDLETFAR